jgi:hypothetical protein
MGCSRNTNPVPITRHKKPEHTYWKGFPSRTAEGLLLEHLGVSAK